MALETRPTSEAGIADLSHLFRSLYRIRRVEEEVARIYPSDKIKSPIHLSIGQEAIAVGVCDALEPHDVVFGTYRGHATYLAKGGDLKGLTAELYGKATGSARGKGGSMHLIDPAHHVMGSSAVVSTTISHAAGYAYALKLRRSDAIVASFFGDGATEEGAFYEALNFAALRQLPILFICENNGYAVHTPIRVRQARPDGIVDRAEAIGVPSYRFQNDDVLTILREVRSAVAGIRGGSGPRLFECPTYRWKEHVGPNEDYDAGYRTYEEARPWVERDQVVMIGQTLEPSLRAAIESDVEAEVREAFEFAEASPFPDPGELWTHVYAD